ncbi:MAG: UDP-N-acetylmuramate--L-alanine ligase [Bacteroidales bacterium]|jgi:UDP-N-acetylmuramate--alanine ligase
MNLVPRHIYFLGIGGIGMSALARYYKHLGYTVSGYDLTRSTLTNQLENEGIEVHFEEDITKIPANPEMVVYTPAVPTNNHELVFCRESGTPLIKRAALLGKISQQYTTIAIAGTHGKTSITALVAHLLHHAGRKTTAFIGGITKNYQSNLILSDETEFFVVEADEFDRSFLMLHPSIAVISSMDADHLDIYQTHSALTQAFIDFSHQLKPDGLLIHNSSLSSFFNTENRTLSYGLDDKQGLHATNIHVSNHKFVFDLVHGQSVINNICLQVPGKHFIENALAATGVALELGLTDEEIKSGLNSFAGVERRFDVRFSNDKMVYIDDYAHHPEEIRATISAVKTLYPTKKVMGIFQPHLYSRTRDFAKEFAHSLETLDTAVLLDIYPAREKPIEGITSNSILSEMDHQDKHLALKSDLFGLIKASEFDILLTMGAGDIGQLAEPLEQMLKSW